MCGIAGIIHWDKAPVDPAELSAMASLLKHRGPDEQNTESPSTGVGLAHCRLKVIDLSALARQPMSDESGRIWLLFNGEIYNFKELKAELVSAGCRFRSQSDTEVILRAYETWGKEAIRRLDGMFSIAIWDESSHTLLLARDRTGKKPLYYYSRGQCTVFGSEIKALLAHAHVPRQVNEELLPYLLAFGSSPVDQTLYREIRQIPPAALLEFDGLEVEPRPETYWSLPWEGTGGAKTSPQAREELRELLTSAVKKRLVSDVPLGAFLSGGIDSTLIVGLMCRLLKEGQVKTFSVGFEGDERFNETSYAQEAARRFRTLHTSFRIGPQPFELIEKLVWYHDQPFADSSALPMYLLSQWTRSHVTVALSGDGGDELFAGYDRFRGALLAERLPRWVWRGASRLFGPAFRLPGLHVRSFPYRAGRFFESAGRPLLERALYWRSILADPREYLPTAGRSSPHPFLEFSGRKELGDSGSSPLDRLLHLNFNEYLPCDLLVKTDRCSMAHGLEVRSPFLDTRLIEWAFRLPGSFKIRGRESKWILRRAFSDLLPVSIQKRGKMGFGVPLGTWFRKQWRQGLQDLLTPATACVYRYLNRPTVQDLMARHFKGVEDAGHRLWLLLTLEVWLRRLTTQQTSQTTAEVVWLERSGS